MPKSASGVILVQILIGILVRILGQILTRILRSVGACFRLGADASVWALVSKNGFWCQLSVKFGWR